MEDEIKKALDECILKQIETLNTMNASEDDYNDVVKATSQLYNLRLEENKAKTNVELENLKRKDEKDFKEKQLKEQRKGLWVQVGIGAAEIILPLLTYRSFMKKGFKFEETGTFTSMTFKNLIGNIKPRR